MKFDVLFGLFVFLLLVLLTCTHELITSHLMGEVQFAILFTFLCCLLVATSAFSVIRAVYETRARVREAEDEEEQATIALGHPMPEVRGRALSRLIMAVPRRIGVFISAVRGYGFPLLLSGAIMFAIALALLALTLGDEISGRFT
jgi:hypothetical protein